MRCLLQAVPCRSQASHLANGAYPKQRDPAGRDETPPTPRIFRLLARTVARTALRCIKQSTPRRATPHGIVFRLDTDGRRVPPYNPANVFHVYEETSHSERYFGKSTGLGMEPVSQPIPRRPQNIPQAVCHVATTKAAPHSSAQLSLPGDGDPLDRDISGEMMRGAHSNRATAQGYLSHSKLTLPIKLPSGGYRMAFREGQRCANYVLTEKLPTFSFSPSIKYCN